MSQDDAARWMEESRKRWCDWHRKALIQEASGLKPLGSAVVDSENIIAAHDKVLSILARLP